VLAVWRERKPPSPQPNRRPGLAFLSVFACGIAVKALLVTLIRPVPKIGDADFEIGSEQNSDNQPVPSTPNRILSSTNGGTHPLVLDNEPKSFGKRVLSVMLTLIDKVWYPNTTPPDPKRPYGGMYRQKKIPTLQIVL
jgi:hypothetical protein